MNWIIIFQLRRLKISLLAKDNDFLFLLMLIHEICNFFKMNKLKILIITVDGGHCTALLKHIQTFCPAPEIFDHWGNHGVSICEWIKERRSELGSRYNTLQKESHEYCKWCSGPSTMITSINASTVTKETHERSDQWKWAQAEKPEKIPTVKCEWEC